MNLDQFPLQFCDSESFTKLLYSRHRLVSFLVGL